MSVLLTREWVLPQSAQEGESNIINTMSNMGFIFRAAPGVSIDSGIAKINDALSWDDTEPMTDENCPQLFFSDQCENTISSMLEYAGRVKAITSQTKSTAYDIYL